jgi:two-component system OmpR family response regulator
VEDDQVARRAISLLLKSQGFAVSEAGTLAEAMRSVSGRRRPDWVLLDVMLPDGSGLDVLRRIKSEGSPIKVCVITGCHEHVLEEARVMGTDCAFSKPLEMVKVIAVLRQ